MKYIRKNDKGLTRTERLLCDLVDDFAAEDRSARERQMLLCKKLKLFWDNYQQLWFSEIAHDWRINVPYDTDEDQSVYDKPVNVFRAYIETLIAALSAVVPPIECYPDDADNSLDILTAKTGDKVGRILYRHNNAPILFPHAVFIWMTEGMVGMYQYKKSDKEYGITSIPKFETRTETLQTTTCPNCGYLFNEADLPRPETTEDNIELPAEPGLEPPAMEELCPSCGEVVVPTMGTETNQWDELVALTELPKSRICLEAYGALNIKINLAAKKKEDIAYLLFDKEMHYAIARAKYPQIRDKITPGPYGGNDYYYRQMRENNMYVFGEPDYNITERHGWLTPESFQKCDHKEDSDHLLKKFPNGVKVTLVNDELACYEDEKLHDCWTFSHNPLSDYLQHDPVAMFLVSIQEITNDLVSLILQTVEHGIPQTMADPRVLDFKKYRQTQAGPGMIIPANPQSGKSLGDAFYDIKTATLSPEVFPFANMIQQLGQQVSGAMPALFGGEMQDNKTASGLSMARNQSLQRLQTNWKMLTTLWKDVFAKAIPAYISEVKTDETHVEKNQVGNFVNTLIRVSELEGKIGSVELEANENLPLTWLQRKDIIIQLMSTQNPQFLEALAAPENLPIMQEALGLAEFYMPGEDDRNKQYDEIKLLLESEPIVENPDEMALLQAEANGMMPPEPQEFPSVEVEQYIDNHAIQFEICRRWLVSDAGRLAKIENEPGYRNVLLHAMQHQMLLQPPPMEGDGANPEKSNPLETNESAAVGDPNAN